MTRERIQNINRARACALNHISVFNQKETQERDVNWCVDKEQITILFVETTHSL